MLLKPTVTPHGGPGFSLTCSQEEIDAARFDQLQVEVVTVIDQGIPVAFVVVRVPPDEVAVYAPDLSEESDRAFTKALASAEFYDIKVELWNDPSSNFWASAEITEDSQGPTVLDAVLSEPTPTTNEWAAAAERAASKLGFSST